MSLSDKPALSDLDKWLKAKKLPRTQKTIRKYQKTATYKAKLKSASKGTDLSYTSSDAPWRIVYGLTRVPGVISFIHTSSKKQQLHVVATIAAHLITSVDEIYVDQNAITFNPSTGLSTGPAVDDKDYLGRVFRDIVCLGDPNQAVNPSLFAAQPTFWTAYHRQRNRAYVYLRFYWDAMCFQGMPALQFLIKGKPIYDPRTATTAYSNNAALVIADYLTDSVYGCGFSWSEIDLTSLAAAADVCDEAVPLRVGGTEARYTINGSFETSEDKKSVLENMAAAMGGFISFQNGSWKFYPGKYRAACGIVLDEDDLRGAVKVQTLSEGGFNSIRGQYIAAAHDYDKTDFPAVSVSAYVAQDNNTAKWQDFDYPFTTSPGMAQRLARIALEEDRRRTLVEAPFGLNAYPLEVGDVFVLELEQFGWTPALAKTFVVLDYESELSADMEMLVNLKCRETDSGVYGWNETVDEQLVNDAPETALPLPYDVRPPTNLTLASGTDHLYLRTDGTVFARIYVSWAAPEDEFVISGGHIQVEYKRSADSVWLPGSPVDGNQTNTYILDVQDGQNYDVRVRSVNGINVYSTWTTAVNHTVIGKTAPPSNVTGFTAELQSYGVVMTWNAVSDLDLAGYEIRTGASWATGTLVAEVRATQYVSDSLAAGAHNYFIKARDTSKNYSTTEAQQTVTIVGPSTPSLSSQISGPDLVLSWTPATSEFAIADYSLYYGTTYAGAVLVTTTRATAHTVRVDWAGTGRFWLEARDIKGNIGSAGSIDVPIVPVPAVTGLTAQVIDNAVLLRWTGSTGGSLPIDHYKVLRGDDFATAVSVGNVSATCLPLFETTGGSYTYWIVPVDTAAGDGVQKAITAQVLDPPDFNLLAEIELTGGTCTNCIEENGTIVGPCLTNESWDYHFSSRGWDTLEEKADAGYEIYAEPYATYGRWEKITDHGATLTGVMIRASFLEEVLSGTPDTKCCLGYSDDDVTYTNEDDVTALFGASFQYTRVRFDWGTVPEGAGEPVGLLLAITKAA